MTDDFITHLNAARFIAQRAHTAPTVEVTPVTSFALPGALVPITADRLAAHQDDGLEMRAIVDYENRQFLKANAHVVERHRRWVARDYDAMVQAHREIEMEKRRRDMEAAAAYQRRLAAILAKRDGADA